MQGPTGLSGGCRGDPEKSRTPEALSAPGGPPRTCTRAGPSASDSRPRGGDQRPGSASKGSRNSGLQPPVRKPGIRPKPRHRLSRGSKTRSIRRSMARVLPSQETPRAYWIRTRCGFSLARSSQKHQDSGEDVAGLESGDHAGDSGTSRPPAHKPRPRSWSKRGPGMRNPWTLARPPERRASRAGGRTLWQESTLKNWRTFSCDGLDQGRSHGGGGGLKPYSH